MLLHKENLENRQWNWWRIEKAVIIDNEEMSLKTKRYFWLMIFKYPFVSIWSDRDREKFNCDVL